MLHNVSYIIGAIDSSLIPILASIIGREDYYYRKSFHQALLQGIGNTNCMFWDYELRWSEGLYD